MELLQLKYFQTAAYTEHISKAAAQLNIAQPSLSLTIKRLENELGTSLFIRKGRNIQLSASGKILLKHVDRIFMELENAQKEIQSEEQLITNTIRISISNPRFLSRLITEYINRYPDAQVQQGIKMKSDIISCLKKGEIDLGIAGHPTEDEEIESCLLVDEDIVLVLPVNHRLAGQSELSLAEVAHEPFISLADNEEYSEFIKNLCEQAGFVPNSIFEVDSYLLSEIIKVNQGVTLLPISVCRQLQLDYVQIADLSPSYSVSLFWVRDKWLSDAASSFRDFIIQYYRDNHDMFKLP
ncbi:LysR family transcriptional regulator [Paenibacillus bovis]|uniref:LysR family transcriptional regulator n=1 Tax=Paenibacillus bovis TaxID=1616788 RepID=A0A172ZE65_9BACL|nr:LysR family transcriptional regulator [Paenibacillus bovis]ANF95918.1 LysR family transcriptional regulator [Paenibacillus bovis]